MVSLKLVVSLTMRAESRREKLRDPVGWSLDVSRQKGKVYSEGSALALGEW